MTSTIHTNIEQSIEDHQHYLDGKPSPDTEAFAREQREQAAKDRQDERWETVREMLDE